MRGLARKFETLNFNLLHFPVYRDREEFFLFEPTCALQAGPRERDLCWSGVLLQTRPSFSPVRR